MVEVLVEFDYTAEEPDELTIKKGDIIKDVSQKSEGWWEGTLHDKKGVFPDNFVKILTKEGVVLRNKRDLARVRQCKALFSYNQDHEDELNLKVGDIIDIIGEEEEGWWRGLLNGKVGVFPSNFVEEITPALNRPKPGTREDLKIAEPVPALPAKPVKQQCEARFSYSAQNSDELTLKEGDIITILSKDGNEPGWWKGEISGRIGMFPDNFVVLLPFSGDEKKSTPSGKAESHPTTDSSANKPSSVAAQRKSLEPKSEQRRQVPKPKAAPPVPGKKPSISVKKSPSATGLGLLTKLKDKIADAVDGATSSKAKAEPAKEAKENNAEHVNSFDQVERRPLLSDVRANRARPPGRRLPTSTHKDEEEGLSLLNGHDLVGKSEEGLRSSSDILSTSSSEVDGSDGPPKVRQWEKNKAPWLEEMKLNQAKRSSVSPVPELRPKQPVGADSAKPDSDGSKSSQNSPADKEVNIADMSKSMSEIKISPMELKPIPKPYKTPPNELEQPSPLQSKPVVSSVNRHSIGSTPKESPPRLPSQKISPRPKMEAYENVITQKAVTGFSSATSFTSVSHSSNFSQKSTSASTSASGSFMTADLLSLTPSPAPKLEKVGVSLAMFNEVLDRLEKLENKCEQQGQLIEALKNRLQVETEMRMILQEKVMHNNVQV
ncbi:SH3 domain-containing kinase-binding protein 1 isoform X1 [Dendroctonus ponderosae]|uniref:SH3 domain-containing protein n=1 Tax=Dendroctonus ponderosae TaxID=77166 RepID=A0AAR5PGP3_DENPD|nr:SH3 domain-containing kinase-binding protein 1 isoform X1 [Dendroctonus ponderosae]